MRQALFAIFFLAVAVGSAAFQSQMKAWPQVVAMVVAILPIIGHFTKQDLAFSRAWLLLLAIALFEALCAGAQ